MPDFERGLCADLTFAEGREWLVTNGIGGYAAGTVAGILTRRYHGLLIAALEPPLARRLLVAKLDATAVYDGHTYDLYANRWSPSDVEIHSLRYLERFHLEGTTPVWTYACADAVLTKRIWMEHGANTTYIRYELHRATYPLGLKLRALVNCRDHHANTEAEGFQAEISPTENGLSVTVENVRWHLLSQKAQLSRQHTWNDGFYLGVEAFRGLDEHDASLYAGLLDVTLQPGASVTVVVTTEAGVDLDGERAYAARHAYEQDLMAQSNCADSPLFVQQLILAADQFIVQRTVPDDLDGRTVLAGYPWFADWGRDTMISLPGLTLSTGRPDVARQILRTFAHFMDRGMLPNRFPEEGQAPEYNTVDATLWYFEAIRAYHQVTGDDELLHELFPVLQDIIDWHRKGTRYNIHLDPSDGLLYAGEPGAQLTWMDVKIGEWVVTPRYGKAVEINALWLNALHTMAEFARRIGEADHAYVNLARHVEQGFARFWNAAAGYCYDVLDTPEGDDAALRPNQLIALALPHCPLNIEQQRQIVDICARKLVTSYGLRSLSPDEEAYIGQYGGDQVQRDSAYHQGTVWGWLIGPFIAAHLRVYGDPDLARSYLQPVMRQLETHCVGSISEIFEGDSPFAPRGCFAQAWSVAEVLRAWRLIENWPSARKMRNP